MVRVRGVIGVKPPTLLPIHEDRRGVVRAKPPEFVANRKARKVQASRALKATEKAIDAALVSMARSIADELPLDKLVDTGRLMPSITAWLDDRYGTSSLQVGPLRLETMWVRGGYIWRCGDLHLFNPSTFPTQAEAQIAAERGLREFLTSMLLALPAPR
jgi:hypothetical protein